MYNFRKQSDDYDTRQRQPPEEHGRSGQEAHRRYLPPLKLALDHMLARQFAATRVVRTPLLSRSVVSWTPDTESEIYDTPAKRGSPRKWDGLAQPVNPANLPLLRLLQACEFVYAIFHHPSCS